MRIFIRVTGATWLALCLLTLIYWWITSFLATAVLPPGVPAPVSYLAMAAVWLVNVLAGGCAVLARRPVSWRPMAALGAALVVNGWILLRAEAWLLPRVRGDASWMGLAWADGVPAVLFSAVGLGLLARCGFWFARGTRRRVCC